MSNKLYYVYKITNKLNGKFYIGKHIQSEKESFDLYYGSGKLIKSAISKYGKENFKKEILEICNKDNLSEREKYWIDALKALTFGYNLSFGGEGGNSTIGTKVYTNGVDRLYLKNFDKAPKGFYLGTPKYSITQRINMSIGCRGKNKNHIPWNKGKDVNNDSVRKNAENARQTILKTGILKGENNPRAKTFLFISPKGEKFEVTGNLRNFCKEHNISMNLVKKFLNKGQIVLSSHNTHKETITLNSVGWEIKCDDKNSVANAKIKREKLYKILYDKNLLTKRQKNINKIQKFIDLKQADKR